MRLRELFRGGGVLADLRKEDSEDFSDQSSSSPPPIKVSTFSCSKLTCLKLLYCEPRNKNIRLVKFQLDRPTQSALGTVVALFMVEVRKLHSTLCLHGRINPDEKFTCQE